MALVAPCSMRILVVEDNPRISSLLARALREEGHVVRVAANGDTGLSLALNEGFDAAVVDVMLPGRDGLSVVHALRDAGSGLPVLLLTARDRSEDKVRGLDAGADDYLTKPFDVSELAARLRALLRRGGPAASTVLRAGDVELDPARHEVRKAGHAVELTAKEFALLEYLMRNANRTLSRATLMEHVWGIRFETGTNVVDVFVNALRNKVDRERTLIRTVRGIGYAFDDPAETP